MKFHPDHNLARPEAAEHFKQIQQAYEAPIPAKNPVGSCGWLLSAESIHCRFSKTIIRFSFFFGPSRIILTKYMTIAKPEKKLRC